MADCASLIRPAKKIPRSADECQANETSAQPQAPGSRVKRPPKENQICNAPLASTIKWVFRFHRCGGAPARSADRARLEARGRGQSCGNAAAGGLVHGVSADR